MNLTVSEHQLLPAFCKPYPDEVLSSWLTRMAFNHGLGTKDFCSLIWGKLSGLDVDMRISDENIRILGLRTGCSFQQIKQTTLSSYANNILGSINEHCVDKWMIGPSRGNINSYCSGMLYCPDCLTKKQYFKKQWRLAISFACTECNCYLQECCPYCGGGSSFMSNTDKCYNAGTAAQYLLICHNCGNDVSTCESKPADDNIVYCQQRLYDIAKNGMANPQIDTESYFKMLHHLARLLLADRNYGKPLKSFVNDVYNIHGYHNVIEPAEPLKLVRKLSLENRIAVVTMAEWLLDEWPYRFIDLCNKHNVTSQMILSGIRHTPLWFWEPVYDELEHTSVMVGKGTFRRDTTESLITIKTPKHKTLDYDYDLSEYYYDDEEYIDVDFELYLYNMNNRRINSYQNRRINS